ncbi:MAG TPA: TonB-dependent receptor [Flavobacteriales bacterium]|nr:TonB-dependent receptor [Flavobacteriales bacterium]HRJ38766.1 TonB-dependent receptor [Flavobacteriales bacterium]
MRFCFLFILSVLIPVCSVSAQRSGVLKGRVVDELGKPLKDVNIYVTPLHTGTTTNEDGTYLLILPSDSSLSVSYSYSGHERKTILVRLKKGEEKTQNVLLQFQTLIEITVDGGVKRPPIEKMPKIEFKQLPTMTGNVEDLIKSFGMGVSSNNEMSAQYSVRGGNFDENLIYVNDIEIYRPFLVRSGQQEGLSFINSDMVEDIYFSSGGFEARYGDKMSSVLDIKYKSPIEKKGSASMSLLGGSVHFEGKVKQRFSYITAFRYRSNSYVLNALPTKGDYRPVFADGQFLLTYKARENWNLSFLGHYSNNLYRMIPETRETDFGTVNEALRLTVFFDGQEITRFETMTGALTSEHILSEKTTIKFIGSVYRSIESESFDIQGQYRLSELERDLGSENFGEVLFVRGVGTFLNHARNRLDAFVYNVSHLGQHELKNGAKINWGLRYQGERINDKLSEWNMLDSAGFSIPQIPSDQIILNDVIKAKIRLSSSRYTGHLQYSQSIDRKKEIKLGDSTFTSISSWDYNFGARGNFWDFNDQLLISPRAGITYVPSWFRIKDSTITRINAVLRFKTGVYYQPPFYRELRDLSGNINYNLRAQRSIHFVLGGDLFFKMWDRTFKFSTELYYKMLNDLNPYEVDNVRIRYYANNNAIGYAKGWDFKINGEFIKGIESWATLGFLKTQEDIKDDYYYTYYNSNGEVIVPGYTFNNIAVDSTYTEPGYIPRPTDQFMTFGLFFQDEMPNWPTFKVHLNALFGTRLPYGPPGFERYKDVLRTPPYRRIDIGFSKQFLTRKEQIKPGSFFSKLSDMWLSLEVFNLLGINNTISYMWIEDVNNRQYAVPNYLTSRRVNLKLSVKF